MSNNKSPLKFFLLVFGLSIPFWIVDLMIDAKRTLSLNFSTIDIVTAFIPIIAGRDSRSQSRRYTLVLRII